MKYVGHRKDVVIPGKDKDGNTITSIGSGAFRNCAGITELLVPDTVTSIGSDAFYGCSGIETLVLPGLLTDIGSYAFRGCDSLREVTLPVDIDTGNSFTGITTVETIHYLKGGTGVMPDWTNSTNGSSNSYQTRLEYYSRKSLKNIDFEEGVTHIGAYAYYSEHIDNPWALVRVTLPESLESIGTHAFFNLKSLRYLNIGEKCTSIGEDNFWLCDRLVVAVSRYNATAIQWLKWHGVSFYYSGVLKAGVSQCWLYTNDAEPLFVMASADGGQRPYQYRFALVKDGEDVELTDWSASKSVYFNPEDKESEWYVRAEVRDYAGDAAVSETIAADKYIDYALIDTHNQLQLLNAMDPDAAIAIAEMYEDIQSDYAYQYVASKLRAIVNATSYEEKVMLVADGTLSDLAIDHILDMITLSDGLPVFPFAYAATDFFAGTGSYAEAMNHLMWACDALETAEVNFHYAITRYENNYTEKAFKDLMYYFTNYLELAASVEEAYVDVVKWQEKTPICDTPAFVLAMKSVSSQKAEALRDLAKSVRMVKFFYDTEDNAGAAGWLNGCYEEQEALKTIIAKEHNSDGNDDGT